MKVFSLYPLFLCFYAIESAKLSQGTATLQEKSLSASSTTELSRSNSTAKQVIPKSQSEEIKTAIAATTAKVPTITSTTRKSQPPKKYTPVTKSASGPTKISLTRSNAITPTVPLTCPKESEAKFNLFAPPCSNDHDCTVWNKEERCCKLFGSKTCIKGVPKPAEEPSHDPFFGLIPRRCPVRPLAELWWDLTTCETDNDCWPRICCPDGQKKYCRTSTLEYSAVPLSFGRPIAYLSEYLECTAPPPQVFDLHPKECNSTLDCFPNVCCQEAGKRRCRPPKKSVLPLMANFLNAGLLRRFTNNLVIR